MTVSEIKLYGLLNAKIGQGKAEAFIQLIGTKIESKLNEKTSIFATKEDIAKPYTKISELKVNIIKWMIATVTAVVGLTVTLIKLG